MAIYGMRLCGLSFYIWKDDCLKGNYNKHFLYSILLGLIPTKSKELMFYYSNYYICT